MFFDANKFNNIKNSKVSSKAAAPSTPDTQIATAANSAITGKTGNSVAFIPTQSNAPSGGAVNSALNNIAASPATVQVGNGIAGNAAGAANTKNVSQLLAEGNGPVKPMNDGNSGYNIKSLAEKAAAKKASNLSAVGMAGNTVPKNPMYNENGNLSYKPDGGVRAIDYFNNMPDAHVTWDSSLGELFLNGNAIPKDQVYLSGDGRAYVSKALLDNMYAQSIKENPYSLESRIGKLDDSRKMILDEMDRIRNYGEFDYDYRKDPMFEIYEKYYDQLGDAAVKDAVAKMAGRTGGYLNSNALAAAYQNRNYWDSQKANIIPTLEKQAYDRWFGERELEGTLIGKALDNIATNDQSLASLYSDEFNRDWQRDESDKTIEFNYNKLRVDDDNTDAARASEDANFRAQLDADNYNKEQDRIMQKYGIDVNNEQFKAEMEQRAKEAAASDNLNWASLELEEKAMYLENEYKYAALNQKNSAPKYSNSVSQKRSGASSGTATSATTSNGMTAKVVL